MNDPNPQQSGNVDSARQQILALVREIELLADSKASPDLFYPEYLKRVAMALGADAAVVWLLDDRQQLALKHFVQRQPLGIFETPQARAGYDSLLREALQSGGVRVYRPGDSRAEGAPTQHVLIVGALQQGTKPLGVLQILQRTEAPESARAGYLQFVEQMCAYVPRYLKSFEQPAAALDVGKEMQELRRVLLELHRSLSVLEVASVAANDGARFLGCDRVSVLEQYGAHPVVRAISGQEAVNSRSNLVRLMTRLTEQVLATGEPLRYAGKPEGLAPQIEEPLAEFLDVSRSRLLTIVPVLRPDPSPGTTPGTSAADSRKAAERKRPLGALIIEQVTDSRLRADFETRLEVLTEHVAQALVNAQEHQKIPFLPVWEFVGEQTALLKGRRLAQTIAALVAIAAVIACLTFVPWDYRVEGKGRMMPADRQNVFAPWDGKVVEIAVSSGQQVEKGQLLLRLQNEELHARWLTTASELNEKKKQLLAQQEELAKSTRSNLPRDEVARLRGKTAMTQIEVEGAEQRLAAITDLEKSLVVHAPIAGVVATFQIRESLANRPVRRGELLLEVMNQEGAWRLELEVPEPRLGHILIGQEQLQTPNLPIEFVLATATEKTLPARLESTATRSASSEEGGTVVEVFASLDTDQLPHRRIGAEVTAKINCGRRSLGYVLFGDVIEFIRKRLWL
jgi:multidrug efflux pump subunit AcrA (membrane-fusion protein)